MSFFSRKTKKFAGGSNARLMKDNEYPRALKDSTAAYIADLPSMTDKFATTISDYNNKGIQDSIVFNSRKAINYTRMEEFQDVTGATSMSVEALDVAVIMEAIKDEMLIEFGQSLEINYMLMEWYDFAHLTKHFLSQDYGFEPINNTISIGDKDYWVHDAILHLNYKQDTTPVGLAFSARAVPGRPENLETAYSEWDYREDKYRMVLDKDRGKRSKVYLPTYYTFREGVTLDLIELYKHDYIEEFTITTNKGYSYIDPDTGEEVIVEETIETSDSTITDLINTLPAGTSVTVFDNNLLDEDEEVLEDTETIKVVKVTRLFQKTYYPTTLSRVSKFIDFSEYYNVVPDKVPPLQEEHTEEEGQATEDYIDQVENDEIPEDIFSSEYMVSIEFSYINSVGDRVIDYRTLVDNKLDDPEDGDMYQRYHDIIMDSVVIRSFGRLFPNLYLRHNHNDIASDYHNKGTYQSYYPVYNKYAKRIGIDYKNFLDDIKESQEEDKSEKEKREMRDDWSKTRKIYLTAGVPINTKDPSEIKYAYEFFKLYSEDREGDHYIQYRDDNGGGRTNFKWELIHIKRHIGQIYPDKEFEKDTHYKAVTTIRIKDEDDNGDSSVLTILRRITTERTYYKQTSANEYIELKIADYSRSMYVHNGKWAGTGNSNSKDIELIIPTDIDIVNTYFKAFNDREAILSKSLRLEFLAYVEKKESFLESTFGQIISFAIGVAISLINPAAGAGWFAGVTVATVMTAIVVNMIISIALDMAFQMIVKAFGPKFAKYLAIVIAVTGLVYGKGQLSKTASATSQRTLMASSRIFFNKTTIMMLSASDKLFNMSMQQIGVEFEEEMKEKRQKLEDFQTYAESILAYKIDDSGDYLDDFTRNYISPHIGLGMSIDEIMYDATDYNKMATSIEYVHDYAGFILELPTLNETIRFMHSAKQQ